MVKCGLRVANTSCLHLVSYELRIFASYERIALIVRITSCTYYASCELNESYELEIQKRELQPKWQVACFLLKRSFWAK